MPKTRMFPTPSRPRKPSNLPSTTHTYTNYTSVNPKTPQKLGGASSHPAPYQTTPSSANIRAELMRPYYLLHRRMYSPSSIKTVPSTPSMPMIQSSNVLFPWVDTQMILLTNVEKMPNGIPKEIASTCELHVTSSPMNRSSCTTEFNTGPMTPSTFLS